jgi:hypothetical protein
VSKCLSPLANDNSLWRPICERCVDEPPLPHEPSCKEHVRDEHLHRLQCEALLWLMQVEEKRRRYRARLRKLKQIFLPLVQGVFVLFLLFWPGEPSSRGSEPAASGSRTSGGSGSAAGGASCADVQYQYSGTWHSRHALSPTVRVAAA